MEPRSPDQPAPRPQPLAWGRRPGRAAPARRLRWGGDSGKGANEWTLGASQRRGEPRGGKAREGRVRRSGGRDGWGGRVNRRGGAGVCRGWGALEQCRRARGSGRGAGGAPRRMARGCVPRRWWASRLDCAVRRPGSSPKPARFISHSANVYCTPAVCRVLSSGWALREDPDGATAHGSRHSLSHLTFTKHLLCWATCDERNSQKP